MLGELDVVLVTGGTGFTGEVLVRRLCDLGCEVRVIVRESSNRTGLSDLPVKWFEGDVFQADVVERAAKGVNYIFHVAAAYREAKIDDLVYQQVHVDSTKLLAKAALRNTGFKRFVHVSTVGVLGHIENPPASELTAYNPGDIYQSTKTVAEQWILKFSKENNFPMTVVRPAPIYGPGDRRLLKLFKFANWPVIPILGYSQGLYHLIHVEDLVEFMLVAAEHENTVGQVYICGNSEATTIKDIISTIATKLKKSPLFIRLPAWPFFVLGSMTEIVCKPFNVNPPIYPRRVAFFTKDRSFNTEKMRSDTGFSCRYSNEDGLSQTLDWYKKNKWI